MENEVKEVVLKTLKIDESKYNEDLAAGDIPEWDSLAHTVLLQEVENKFNITLDVGDAIDIESVSDLIATVKQYKSQ